MFSRNFKSVLTASVIAVIVFAFYANSYSKTSGDDKTVIKLPSMQCKTCKKKITKALQGVDGVKDVNVNLETKEATVTYDNSSVNVSQLENAITAAGYDANDKKADASAYDKLDDCCKVPKEK
jgi:mercuric ion binding protein